MNAGGKTPDQGRESLTMSTTKARKPRSMRLLDGVPPDKRIVITDVTWDVYENLVDSIREGENCRIAFDGKDIEVMTLGPHHESLAGIVDAFVANVARGLGVEHRALGSTTWRRKDVERGVEPDGSYYFNASNVTAYDKEFAPGLTR